MAVSEVRDIADAEQLLSVDRVFDLVDHSLRSDQVGQFSDHKSCFSGADGFHADARAHFEASATSGVGLGDSLKPDDGTAGGQVGPGHKPHEVFQRCLRVLNQVTGRSHYLMDVMRGHVGGHSHSNPAGAIDQQVRQCCR